MSSPPLSDNDPTPPPPSLNPPASSSSSTQPSGSSATYVNVDYSKHQPLIPSLDDLTQQSQLMQDLTLMIMEWFRDHFEPIPATRFDPSVHCQPVTTYVDKFLWCFDPLMSRSNLTWWNTKDGQFRSTLSLAMKMVVRHIAEQKELPHLHTIKLSSFSQSSKKKSKSSNIHLFAFEYSCSSDLRTRKEPFTLADFDLASIFTEFRVVDPRADLRQEIAMAESIYELEMANDKLKQRGDHYKRQSQRSADYAQSLDRHIQTQKRVITKLARKLCQPAAASTPPSPSDSESLSAAQTPRKRKHNDAAPIVVDDQPDSPLTHAMKRNAGIDARREAQADAFAASQQESSVSL